MLKKLGMRLCVLPRSTVFPKFFILCTSIKIIIVGSTDQESSQQLRTWFSELFFAPKLVA